MTNWTEYNESLRRRGDLTVWISDDALGLWSAPRRTTRGGQRTYSDLAIEICLTLSAVYKQQLRQTQGFMRSIATLLGVEIAVPDFSTLSRRGKGLTLPATRKTDRSDPVHLVVDSTGLKVFGEGEWFEQKHKTSRKRRSWRKLHLGLDLVSGEIVCSDLTKDDVGDSTALPVLLDQVDGPVSHFLAGGAYDGEQHLICLPPGSDRRLRTRFHRQ
ncbi:Transposase DDE domain-containing protein [Ruegeria halocynthiae]|uniref:Transposase DDE domain-containing protein n=1 Tax=Ruegeria halocynthiae TaxID=985054 RepID=A0A1H3ETW9_9RHOB|nr:Transposase DDE domain-containing protein [Ruegeria halocynthiae]